MNSSGGTEGGLGKFILGFTLMAAGIYLFFDSVRVITGTLGWISGYAYGWFGQTASTGIVFIPFILGVMALFYDASKIWCWLLFWGGLGVVAIDIMSRVHFMMNVKTSHLLLMFALFAAGVGMMLHSFIPHRKKTYGEEN